MPRSPTILTPPPGILPFVPNTTIRSQDANALFNDLYQDGNTPRPISYGGTGASNAQDALQNLGGISQSNFLSAFSVGDGYYSVRDISSAGGTWLKRNGALYDSVDYPLLADILPPLPDGVEWTNLTAPASSLVGIVVTPSGYYICSLGSGDTAQIWKSSDGSAYALISTISNIAPVEFSYNAGIFIVSGAGTDGSGKITSSTDGIAWSSLSNPGVGAIVNSSATDGTLYVAVGNSGAIATSTDLLNWTSRSSGTTQTLRSVKFINSNFVATGNSGSVTTSADGISYTNRTTSSSATLFSATYGDGLYVVVGSGGTILTSPNLSAWTPRTSGASQDLRAAVHSSAGFMVSGASGVIRISTNGTAWASSPSGVSASLIGLSYNPTNEAEYFAVGTSTVIKGLRTLATQFRVPNDSPQYGWIKAEND